MNKINITALLIITAWAVWAQPQDMRTMNFRWDAVPDLSYRMYDRVLPSNTFDPLQMVYNCDTSIMLKTLKIPVVQAYCYGTCAVPFGRLNFAVTAVNSVNMESPRSNVVPAAIFIEGYICRRSRLHSYCRYRERRSFDCHGNAIPASQCPCSRNCYSALAFRHGIQCCIGANSRLH